MKLKLFGSIVLMITICHNAYAGSFNCDITSLTYDHENCSAKPAPTNIKQKISAAEVYDRKLRELNKAHRMDTAARDMDMYIATNNKKANKQKSRSNKGMETQLAKVHSVKNPSSIGSPMKKKFDQIGIGAKIPLKPN